MISNLVENYVYLGGECILLSGDENVFTVWA